MKLENEENYDCVIEVKDVNAWYGNNKALKDINLGIPRNMITAFIGPSGCGKTTLLRCFNRLNDIIDSFRMDGTILLDGNDINGKEQSVTGLRRKVGMVFQQPNPFPMTIYDNFFIPLEENIKNLSRDEKKDMAINALKAAHVYDEVKDRLHLSAVRLSGGQQQRLCIARALILKPEVILFDEPCSSLDPISTMKIEELLMEISEKYSVVIVTHNIEQARRIAHQVVFFYEGNIIESGSSKSFFNNPKLKKTQDYLMGVF